MFQIFKEIESNKRQIECSSEFVKILVVNDIVSFIDSTYNTLILCVILLTEIDNSTNKLLLI